MRVVRVYQLTRIRAYGAKLETLTTLTAPRLTCAFSMPDSHEEGTHMISSQPVETEADARSLPAVRAVYAAFRSDSGTGKMAPHNHRLLCEALTAAGVELGGYDHRIAWWLAGWEPQTVAVVASWVQRASQDGGHHHDE